MAEKLRQRVKRNDSVSSQLGEQLKGQREKVNTAPSLPGSVFVDSFVFLGTPKELELGRDDCGGGESAAEVAG